MRFLLSTSISISISTSTFILIASFPLRWCCSTHHGGPQVTIYVTIYSRTDEFLRESAIFCAGPAETIPNYGFQAKRFIDFTRMQGSAHKYRWQTVRSTFILFRTAPRRWLWGRTGRGWLGGLRRGHHGVGGITMGDQLVGGENGSSWEIILGDHPVRLSGWG